MNAEQYNKCVDMFSDSIYRYVLKLLRNVEQAQDCVQECFMKLWERHTDVTPEKAKAYLFTSAHHIVIDIARHEKHRLKFLQQLPDRPSAPPTHPDLQQLLSSLIDKLPEAQRSVLLLRDYEGYSYEEIAEITNLSPAQVKVYIFRARLFMKERLVSIDAVI